MQFGGQGSPYLKELAKLYQEPELKEFFDVSFRTTDEIAARDGKSPFLNEGFNFKAWLENPDSAPSEDYLARAPISVPGIFMTQIANYVLVTKKVILLLILSKRQEESADIVKVSSQVR